MWSRIRMARSGVPQTQGYDGLLQSFCQVPVFSPLQDIVVFRRANWAQDAMPGLFVAG